MKKIKVFLIFFFLFFVIGIIIEAKKTNYSSDKKYYDAINRTKQMVSNSNAIKLAQKHNLNILNITWEDTGRYKGSAVGPNISDMTIQVGYTDPKTQKFSIHLMPVIRFPNYSDLTADLSPSDFTLLVGNHNGKKLKRVSLYDFLKNIRLFLHNPKSWKGNKNSLLADRDTKVLVSAQACFLPVPKKGLALFNPVLFNYQSISGDPAVLTILVTREGTSVTVIDNKRDAFQSGSAWGQRLFHNEKGQRASLTGQRLSDYKASKKVSRKQTDKPKFQLNMVLLIQIPLKQKTPMRFSDDGAKSFSEMPMPSTSAEKSNVEAAVIGHGDLEGPFTEIDNLEIERDLRFPIRVTVQFYKA
ncbi:MAG: hypothetical protein OEV44_10245, partial [Spirochaetota bacterium]|nr:hypothetical protein [Spirochaetota bacterium]